MKILITGGAGYIGSHVVKLLKKSPYDFLVLDNLSTGRRESVLGGHFILGDIADVQLLDTIFRENEIQGVIHFAGSIVVSESVNNPLKYYRNNTENSRLLIAKCLEYGVENLIFSSTAAVYGEGFSRPVEENDPTNPINPYGRSKLMVEWMLNDASLADPRFKFISLRYFNVAGADLDQEIGQCSPEITHLIKRATLAALGKIDKLEVYGTDYSTPDGTAVRDFIHVMDLAQAHLDALNFLIDKRQSHILNCGYGSGYSVSEVIQEVKRISGVNFKIVPTARRPGDPPQLVSNSQKIRSLLKWEPKYNSLQTMIRTAYDWEKIFQKI